MSRKKRKRIRVLGILQGRALRGVRTLRIVSDEEFAYQGYVYHIEDFPPHKDILLDRAHQVEPTRLYEGVYEKTKTSKKNKKTKQKAHKRTYAAQMYSNIGECPDVTDAYGQI